MKISYTWFVAIWFASSLVLIYDGFTDALVTNNPAPIFDFLELIIGLVLLVLLMVNMMRRLNA